MLGGRVASSDADGRRAVREPPAPLAGDAYTIVGKHLIRVVGVKTATFRGQLAAPDCVA